MFLLTSLQRQLKIFLQENDFDLDKFTFESTDRGFKILNKMAKYFFRIEKGDIPGCEFSISFGPDKTRPNQPTPIGGVDARDWNEVLAAYQNWVTWLHDDTFGNEEIESVPERKPIGFVFGRGKDDIKTNKEDFEKLDSDNLSEEIESNSLKKEVEQLQEKMLQLQQALVISSIPKSIRDKLNDIAEESKNRADKMTKEDWFNWFIGSLISSITALALNPAQAQTIFQMVKTIFGLK